MLLVMIVFLADSTLTPKKSKVYGKKFGKVSKTLLVFEWRKCKKRWLVNTWFKKEKWKKATL
jgi:hypothetical protein